MNEATAEATNHPISHPEQPTTTTSPQVTAPRHDQSAKSGTSQVRLRIAGLALYGIPAIAVWIWAIIDASIKPRSYYEEYDA
jgi:hypothetical protein